MDDSYIYDQVEHENEGKQIAEKEYNTALVFVVGSAHEINEALWTILSIIILCNCKAHYNANNKSTEMTKIINICLRQTNLNVEQEDQKNEDDECEPLHGICFAQTCPFNYEIRNLNKNIS